MPCMCCQATNFWPAVFHVPLTATRVRSVRNSFCLFVCFGFFRFDYFSFLLFWNGNISWESRVCSLREASAQMQHMSTCVFLKGLFYVNVASCPKHHTSFQQRCVLCVLSHSHTTLAVSQHLAVFSKSSQIWSSDYQHLLIIKQSVASWSIHVAIYMTASMMITKSNVWFTKWSIVNWCVWVDRSAVEMPSAPCTIPMNCRSWPGI